MTVYFVRMVGAAASMGPEETPSGVVCLGTSRAVSSRTLIAADTTRMAVLLRRMRYYHNSTAQFRKAKSDFLRNECPKTIHAGLIYIDARWENEEAPEG